MSEPNHYNEPWSLDIDGDIQTAPGIMGDLVCVAPRELMLSMAGWPDRRRRILAAVNGTAGIATEALESNVIAETIASLQSMVRRCHQCSGTGVWKLSGELARTADTIDTMPCLDCEQARATLAKLGRMPC